VSISSTINARVCRTNFLTAGVNFIKIFGRSFLTNLTQRSLLRYTGRTICSIPCDGKDDLCLNDEDENCKPSFWNLSFALIIPLLVVTICTGELLIFLNQKSRESEEYEMIISNELSLFQLLKSKIQTGFEVKSKNKNIKRVLKKRFFQIHKKDNYKNELKAAANLLFIRDELSQAYANTIYKLEQEFHKGNIIEMHICIKNHLGSDEASHKLYDLIKAPGFLSRIIPKQLACLIQKVNDLNTRKPVLRLGFLLNVMLKTIVYYLDLMKDVFLIVSISSFIPFSTTEFESFEIQVVFILCLSIVLAIFSNTLLILFNNSILILQNCKMSLAFAMMSVLSPSVAQYIIHRLEFQQKLFNNNFIENPSSNTRQIIQNNLYVKHVKG